MGEKHATRQSTLLLIQVLRVVAVGLGSRTTRLNQLLFVPIAGLFMHTVFFTRSDDILLDYRLAMAVTAELFVSSDFILLRKHQPEIRQIGQKRPTSEMSVFARLWWAAKLSVAARGVGWSFEPTDHLPPRPTTSRRRFIISQLAWLGVYGLEQDIISIIMRAHPCYSKNGPSFGALGWLWRTTIWIHPVMAYLKLSIPHTALSIICVAIGVSEPGDWPHIFDSLWKAYTVRNVWGRVWHQMLRKVCGWTRWPSLYRILKYYFLRRLST